MSIVKIPQRQERKIGKFIIWQNLVLPKDFSLPDLPPLDTARYVRKVAPQEPKAPLSPEPVASPLSTIKQPLPPSHPLPSREGKAEQRGEKGMMGGMEKNEMGQGKDTVENKEIPRAKGLQMWNAEGQEVRSKKQELRVGDQAKTTQPPVAPPIFPKPKIDIDSKLEELKKKAEKKKGLT